MRKKFSFIYPVTKGRVDLNRRWRYEHITDLTVNGIAYQTGVTSQINEESYQFEIDEILFNNVNVSLLLDGFDSIEKIKAACLNHIHHLFTDGESDFEDCIPLGVNVAGAKVISLPLKRMVN